MAKPSSDNRTIGHYRLLDRIGEGAMGVVYKAEDIRLGRTVALKLLAERLRGDAGSLERFLREARAAAAINHPNICTVYDIHDDATGDEPFIAMEFIQGITLRQQIERHRNEGVVMPLEVATSYATQIVRALDAAHRAGVVHRDVKSENIMLDGEGGVKMMDFGLARLDGAERLTRATTMMGTISYMAPEVIQGRDPDVGSDIFSFGVVLYEMLSGRLPFRGVHEAAMMYSIMHEAPDALAQYRDDEIGALGKIVERALAKDRQERYASIGEILLELGANNRSLLGTLIPTSGGSLSRSRVQSSRRSVPPFASTSRTPSQLTPELRVYISGASEDLHEEREYLMKNVFPEIRMLCRERGITFTEVDLRWGLTSDEVSYSRIIRACLEGIDWCRPYFIGIIGESSGYSPTFLDIQKDPALLEAYPWIEDVVIDGMSITEIETEYAALSPSPSPSSASGGGARGGGTRFYFRRQRASLDDVDNDSAERRRVEAFKQRIRQSGVRIEEFREPSLLGEQIHDYLIDVIKHDFADVKPPTPLQKERSRHDAFSRNRRRAYIPNPTHLKRLNDHVASSDPPLVINGESGSGKSSLIAYWAESYRRRNPGTYFIEHYVGIGATATDHYAIIQHFCMEVKERFARDEEIPSAPAALNMAFGQWLGYADHELRKRGEQMVLLLDGLNQLHGSAELLRWIPDVISPSIRLIVSSTDEGMLATLRKRGWDSYGIPALGEAEREAVVMRYLAEHGTSLNAQEIAQIAGDSKCGHPLFLKTLLEEVRLVGRHEELAQRIDISLGSTDTEDLFQKMLERMEDDYSLRSVRHLLVMLWGSRKGLTELELSEVTGLSRMKVATIVAGLEYHLLRKEGRLSFSHDYLRSAVEKRYLGDVTRRDQMHAALARYFEGVALTQRTALELLWQYGADHQVEGMTYRDERLASTLARADVLVLLYQGEMRFEMLEHWAQLVRRGHSPAEYYRQSLIAENPEQSLNRGEVLVAAAALLESLSLWEVAEAFYRELIAWGSKEGGDEVWGHLGLGWVMKQRGAYASAMEHFEEALSLAVENGHRSGMAGAIGNIGLVHSEQGRYAEAMECYNRQLAICDELGDRVGMSKATGNMGLVHFDHGKYAEAMECFSRKLAICEVLGDRSGMSKAFGNIGLVHKNQGRYAEAMECFGHDLAICEEVGDRSGMSGAIGNMGNVHFRQGRYAEAMDCFRRDLAICEELGDRSGISLAIGNIGNVHVRQGEYAEAMECYDHFLVLCEELGDRIGISAAIGNIGHLHDQHGEYDRALQCFAEAIEGHSSIGFRAGLTYWLEGTVNTLLKLLAERVDNMPEYLLIYLPSATIETWQALVLQYARECAEQCLAISEELSHLGMVFTGRILLGRIDAAAGATAEAMKRFGDMLRDTIDEEEQAELHYWLWQICSLSRDEKTFAVKSAAEALRLYIGIVATTPNYDYTKRIEELMVVVNSPDGSDRAE